MPDLTAPGAWDSAVAGVDGIAHVVGSVDVFVRDAAGAAKEELIWQIELLEAARRAGSVKSVVFTSSAWAAWTPGNDEKGLVLDEKSWNDEVVDIAATGKGEGMAGFMAQKTLVEKGVWEWVRREKPGFAFNSVLPDTVMGEVLDPVNQGIPSTAGMVHWVWEGEHVEVLDMMEPQWHVDCQDVAKLYVALLATSPRVDGERIFAFGDKYSWFKVAEILKRLYPEHAEKVAKVRDAGWCEAEVSDQRALEMLRRLGQHQWTSVETSVQQNAESWMKLEMGGVTDHKYARHAN